MDGKVVGSGGLAAVAHTIVLFIHSPAALFLAHNDCGRLSLDRGAALIEQIYANTEELPISDEISEAKASADSSARPTSPFALTPSGITCKTSRKENMNDNALIIRLFDFRYI